MMAFLVSAVVVYVMWKIFWPLMYPKPPKALQQYAEVFKPCAHCGQLARVDLGVQVEQGEQSSFFCSQGHYAAYLRKQDTLSKEL